MIFAWQQVNWRNWDAICRQWRRSKAPHQRRRSAGRIDGPDGAIHPAGPDADSLSVELLRRVGRGEGDLHDTAGAWVRDRAVGGLADGVAEKSGGNGAHSCRSIWESDTGRRARTEPLSSRWRTRAGNQFRRATDAGERCAYRTFEGVCLG